jgi:two-component system response regulator PilR (NtrC family)
VKNKQITPHILVVDNEDRMCKLIQAALELDGYRVDMAFSGPAALEKLGAADYDVVITDLKMDKVDGLQILEKVKEHTPAAEVIIITAFASQETALYAMKNGAYDYLIKPFKMDELSLRVARIFRQKSLEKENLQLKEAAVTPESIPGLIGKSEKMRQVFQKIRQVSRSDAAVLVRGESGTGKELVARAIHQQSSRRDQPFVAINCAALPETLLESELFGYEKGAFTGAVQRKEGLFETADKGSLFLDEIGDLPLNLQVKLLRVLQSNEIIRLGGHEPRIVDFRLITATHRNLEQMIERQQFRQDLYYRINIFPVFIAPLRERKEDLPELIQFFLQNYPDKSLTSMVRKKLFEYDYPGNVRELENILARAAILSDGIIEDVDLPEDAAKKTDAERLIAGEIPDGGIVLDELEKDLIRSAIDKAKGNKSRAAELLGITRRRLYSMMERFKIEY